MAKANIMPSAQDNKPVKKKSKWRWLRTVSIWALISIVLQVGFLYYLENQVTGANAAITPPKPVVIDKSVNLPAQTVENLRASSSKDYLAYTDSQGLKVYNVKANKMAFHADKPAGGDVLYYQWLPDRNTLLYVTARPNPAYGRRTSPSRGSGNFTVFAQRKYDDPSRGYYTSKKYGYSSNYSSGYSGYSTSGAQITEIYAVDLGDPTDNSAVPDSRLASRVNIPAGSTIQSMQFSTYTNLIFALINSPAGIQKIYEIDVMKNVRTVQRSGEQISRMVISDKNGTLYIQSNLYGVDQIVAVKQSGRQQALHGSQYVLLGVADGKVYVGEVENDYLVKILTMNDTGLQEQVDSQTALVWQGSLPWKNEHVVVGTGNYIAIYDDQHASVLENWKLHEFKFKDNQSYVTQDGRDVMEVTPNDKGGVKVVFKPL
ncbi:MAG TPA: hypothetical protein VHQ46_03365 [Desulfobacteria bacterium]|nr:hypothetical protein [Desulfobacteria bacterium]